MEEKEKIIEIELERLKDFPNHPFKVQDDQQMTELTESIKKYGILNPLIVRPVPDGTYEIISGHRRRHAAQILGYRRLPVIIRVMDDDDAVVALVDANLHREQIAPSEKAFAYKMKYDAMRKDGKRGRGSRSGHEKGLKTIQIMGKEIGESPKQVQRYLKLTELSPQMLKLLDAKVLSFTPAFEIAFLSIDDQDIVADAILNTVSIYRAFTV